LAALRGIKQRLELVHIIIRLGGHADGWHRNARGIFGNRKTRDELAAREHSAAKPQPKKRFEQEAAEVTERKATLIGPPLSLFSPVQEVLAKLCDSGGLQCKDHKKASRISSCPCVLCAIFRQEFQFLIRAICEIRGKFPVWRQAGDGCGAPSELEKFFSWAVFLGLRFPRRSPSFGGQAPGSLQPRLSYFGPSAHADRV
jgi:hypothetical protein